MTGPRCRPASCISASATFHRAHQAVYLDDLFNLGEGHDFAIVGAGMLPFETAMRDKLSAQDYLTTVVEQDNDRSAARVTGAMIGLPLPIGDGKAIIEKLVDPAIRIVSMTITEGGYFCRCLRAFRPDAEGDRRRRAQSGEPEDGVRSHRRRSEGAARGGHRAFHRHVLRQHSA